MAELATGRNILTTLDDRVPTSFYWQLTLLATLGGFLFGYDTSNIGSAPAGRCRARCSPPRSAAKPPRSARCRHIAEKKNSYIEAHAAPA
jgi:hypothetical protein